MIIEARKRPGEENPPPPPPKATSASAPEKKVAPTDTSPEKNKKIADHKDEVALAIMNLPDNDPTEKVLQDIDQVLSDVGVGGVDTLLGTLDLSSFGEGVTGKKAKEDRINSVKDELARTIRSISMSKKDRDSLIGLWSQDQLVDVDTLLSPGKHTFEEIFTDYGSNAGLRELVDTLMLRTSYGRGSGEYGLEMMSRQVKGRTKGDLSIKGKGVEVKTLNVDAPRFTDPDISPSPEWRTLCANFKKTYAKELQTVGAKETKSGINFATMHQVYTLFGSSATKTKYQKDLKTIFASIFPSIPGRDIDGIVAAVLAGNTQLAGSLYAKVNIKYYQSIKTEDDGILYISIAANPKWLLYFTTVEEAEAQGFVFRSSTPYAISGTQSDANGRSVYPKVTMIAPK